MNVRSSQKEPLASPIVNLSRACCLLATGAVLSIILSCAIASISAGLQTALIIIGIALLAGAVYCSWKMALRANIDAMKSAQLLQEAKQRTMELAALYDTSHDVSGKNELHAVLGLILERAKKLSAAAGCAIFLVDKEHEDFEIAVEVGVGMPIGTHLPLHRGLAGRVAETLAPVIVEDYQTWPYRSKTLENLPIRATVLVPMMRGGELIGVLGVHEVVGNDRIFTEADARLLSIFAANAAGAVHNARLMDALHNSEERFRIAAGCASDVVYDWDLKADHVDYFGVLFERSKEENKRWAKSRKDYWDMIHPDDCERIREALNTHYETGKPFSEEYRFRLNESQYRSVADRAIAIKNQKGKPIRLIGAVSDITARKEAEKMKSDFVSFVTHQLRTPLSGVKWLLELAIDMIDSPEDVRSYIMDARTSTERLIGLVNDLLDVSRLERGKLQVNYGNVSLEGLTREIVKELAPLITEKEQNVSVDAVALPDLWVDSQLTRQAILNLLSNAMKYTPKGGSVEIKIGQSDDRAIWSIKDTGIGIPASDIGKLFEKFYRAGNVLAVETEGTGLGLYLVRLILERFGGKVWCESEEGKGSTFLFALPLQHRG